MKEMSSFFFFFSSRRRHTRCSRDWSSDVCSSDVMVLPSGLKSTVKEIWTYDGPQPEAFCPQSVTLVLEHDIDISRGDMLVGPDSLPGMSSELQARICWMHPRPLQRGRKYFLKHTAQTVRAVVTSLEGRLNI